MFISVKRRDFRRLAYSLQSLLLIAMVSMWGIWNWRDLSLGDTSYYYRGAQQWAESGAFSGAGWMSFSPLYMSVFGWFVRAFDDAYTAMIAHRIAIVLSASLATYVVARRVLPRAWAWLAAVWCSYFQSTGTLISKSMFLVLHC